MTILTRLLWKSIPKEQRKLLLSLVDEPNRQIVNSVLNQKHAFPSFFDDHQCIFIHIPKTAGISLTHALGIRDNHTWHLPLKYYEATEPEKFHRYFKFGIVRNPWDRVFSAYSFLKRGGLSERDREATRLVNHYQDFNAFILKWLNHETANSLVHFTPMYRFFENRHGNIAIDYIGRFENLQADYEIIKNRFNATGSLPHKNASTGVDYREHFSTQAIDRIADIYQRDIDEFQYSFD